VIGKILFTALVIGALLLYARGRVERSRREERPVRRAAPPPPPAANPTAKLAAIITLIVVLGTGGVLFYLNWLEDHRIVTIRVTPPDGQPILYQAYRANVDGRRFETLDGRRVTLSETDRVEMVEELDP